MKPFVIYPIIVGALTFAALMVLDHFHVAEHSSLRAAIVGGVSSGIAYFLTQKLLGVQTEGGARAL